MPNSIRLTDEYIMINNEKMALYMGAIFNIYFDKDKGLLFPSGKSLIRGVRDCKYHDSWEWLMPVVSRSYQLMRDEGITEPDVVKLMDDTLVYHLKRSNIRYVYTHLIEFIDYYIKLKEHEVTKTVQEN